MAIFSRDNLSAMNSNFARNMSVILALATESFTYACALVNDCNSVKIFYKTITSELKSKIIQNSKIMRAGVSFTGLLSPPPYLSFPKTQKRIVYNGFLDTHTHRVCIVFPDTCIIIGISIQHKAAYDRLKENNNNNSFSAINDKNIIFVEMIGE